MSITAARPYHHGDLASALITAGVEVARVGGPDAVVVREASRRAGVSHNAAYRHFADRDAFLGAVATVALAELGRVMAELIAAVPSRGRPVDRSWDRLRAAGRAYVNFAVDEPGWFRTAFAIPPSDPGDSADPVGAATHPTQQQLGDGPEPYQLLSGCLDELVTVGALPASRRPGAEIAAWSAVHGLATLLVDGPLRLIGPEDREALLTRVLDTVAAGLST